MNHDLVWDVIRMCNKFKKSNHDKTSRNDVSRVVNLSEIQEQDVFKREIDNIYSFLVKQDYDDIKDLISLALMGRDKDYDKDLQGEMRLCDFREYLEKIGVFSSIETDIDYLLEKIYCLENYLIEGLKILEVN